jgi:hypothetical protein
MKFTRKRIYILAIIAQAIYCSTYITLRYTKIIVRYENRAIESQTRIEARKSEWFDLIPSIGVIEKTKVNTLNLIFYPLERIEEVIHDLNTKEPTSR